MQSMKRTLVTVSLVVFGLALAGAQAQSSLEGQLVRVDPDAMTIVVQVSDGTQHELAYTEETEVVGAEGGVAGLATASNQNVMVVFEDGQPPTAISIELR